MIPAAVAARRPGTPTAALQLRDYQLEALAAIEQAEQRGVRRQLLALPTGTGKTIVFAELIRRRGGRALVLAHRDELITQAVDKLALTGVEGIGVIKAERNDLEAATVVASVQTLSQPHRLAQLTEPFTTVIVDEAHHATAETYRRVLEHVGAFTADGPLLVGVTATGERADGTPLGDVFEAIVFERPLLGMIREGYLAPLRALQVQLAADFGQLHTRAGEFIAGEAETLLMDADAPHAIVAAYQAHAATRTAVVFTPTVAVAHAVAAAFTEAGIPAAAVDATTPLEDRRAVLAQFHCGTLKVVANCGILTEGYDEARIDCIIIARPTKSRPLYVQMIGRGTRRYPGKADCLILDVVGASTRHDLMTAATLMGVPPTGAIETSLVEAVDAVRAAAERAAATQRAEAGRLVAQAVDLFRTRPLNWVAAGAGRFALALGEAGTLLLIADAAGAWAVHQHTRERQVRALKSGLDLGYAQGWAEDHARQLGARALIDRAASWRTAPATDKQLAALRRCRVPVPPGCTKGTAADLITAAVAGAWR